MLDCKPTPARHARDRAREDHEREDDVRLWDEIVVGSPGGGLGKFMNRGWIGKRITDGTAIDGGQAAMVGAKPRA